MMVFLSIITLTIFLYNTRQVTSFIVICYLLTTPAIFFSELETGMILLFGFFSYAVGGLIYNYKSRTNVQKLARMSFRNSKEVFLAYRRRLLYSAIFLGIICTFASSVYFAVVGISIFSDNVGVARLENRNAIPGAFFFQRIFRVLFPTVVILLYALYVSKPTSSLSRISLPKLFFIVFVVLNGSFLAFTGIKGNIITFLLIPLLVFHNLYVGRTSVLGLINLTMIATLIIVYMVSNMIPGANIIFLLEFIMFRLGGGATDGLHYVIHYYQPAFGYQYGVTIFQDIFSLFGKLGIPYFDDKSLGQKIAMELLGGNYRGEQAAVTLSGELYLNFGRFGLVLISVLVGYFLQYLYVFSLKKDLSAMRKVFVAYLQSATLLILGGPVFSMLLDYLIFSFLFFISWRFVFSVFLNRNTVNGR